MNGNEIRKALKAKNLSFAAIGRVLGHTTGTAVSRVCHRKGSGRVIANVVSKAMGLSVEEVFPDKPEYADAESVSQKRKQAESKLKEQVESTELVA